MRIAMIGLKALPPKYGGFETAADEIGRRLVESGHHVTVYNRSGQSSHPGKDYKGIELVTLPTLRSKHLSSIVHSFLCSLHCLSKNVDLVHYFITGNTLFAPIPRLFGKKIVCSVDGADWQRKKWGWFARSYLRLSERLAAWFCHGLIADSIDVARYYKEKYTANTVFIPYGMREDCSEGTEYLERYGVFDKQYVLFVGRLVPENNVHLLVAAFSHVKTNKKLIIVGDDPWGKKYIHSLKSTRDDRIIYTGGIYGDGYEQLQKGAYLFVLPDEVGGTHPSLVEAMGFGNCVLVNDTPSNLEVVGDAGFSYRGSEGAEDLRRQLQFLIDNPQIVEEYKVKAKRHALAHYRWDRVVQAHVELYHRVLARITPDRKTAADDKLRKQPGCAPLHQQGGHEEANEAVYERADSAIADTGREGESYGDPQGAGDQRADVL